MPAAEVDVDEALARRLLRDQHPDLAELDLTLLANGWDNVVFRLGDEYTVRLPRRQMAAVLVEHEQRWLPRLAPLLPLPVPAPVRTGVPAPGYPWRWSVCPWLPGRMAAEDPPDPLDDACDTLGRFVAALHQPAPPDAPPNPVRGVPLEARAEITEANIAALDGVTGVDPVRVRDEWRAALATPPWTGTPRWLHGDLHPANILVRDGRLSAVVDFGDITAGDRATDLAVAWMLFPVAALRDRFRNAVGDVDDATWQRSRGWALSLSLAYLANSADNAVIAGIGARTLTAVLGDR